MAQDLSKAIEAAMWALLCIALLVLCSIHTMPKDHSDWWAFGVWLNFGLFWWYTIDAKRSLKRYVEAKAKHDLDSRTIVNVFDEVDLRK